MPKVYVIPNYVKVVRAVLEIYKRCANGQADSQTTPFFHKVETYLVRPLMPPMYVIPNFVKIVSGSRDLERCFHGQTDRQPDFLQG